MSDTDSFIEEVSEEVRKDQLYGYVRKYGWIGALVILGCVGGAGYFEYSKATQTAAAQARGDAMIAALENEAAVDRAAALQELVAEAGEASAIVALQRAAVLAEDNDTDTAVQILTVLSQDTTQGIYSDLASMKLLFLNGQELDPETRKALISRLSAPGQSFRPLALEQAALFQHLDGDTDAAIASFNALLEEPDVSAGLRNRVTQTIVALGGEIETQPVLLNQASEN